MAFRPNWYDEQPKRRGPSSIAWRSWTGLGTIVRVTVAVFVVQYLLARLSPNTGDVLSRWGGLRTFTDSGSINLLFPLQLFTYPLLHATWDIWHILGNMFYLWIFGRELEAVMGKAAFLRLYVAGAVIGGLAQFGMGFATGSAVPTIGASGAVWSIMLLYTLKYPHRTFHLIFPPIPLPVWLLVGFRLVSDILGFVDQLRALGLDQVGPQVALACHLGGALFGLLWFKRGDFLARWWLRHQLEKNRKEIEVQADARQEMDRILGKIQTTGLNSLTPTERSFLDRRSRELRDKDG